jgi:hypothetical protein
MHSRVRATAKVQVIAIEVVRLCTTANDGILLYG